MQGLDRELAEKYGFDVISVIPFKDAYIINSSKGKKILKKSVLFPERILFIHYAKEHLFNKDFKNLDRFLCTADGTPYLVHEGTTYTVTDFIDGRECNFDSRQDIINATSILAGFHASSRGFIPSQDCMVRNELGKLPQYFNKRLDEIKKLKKAAQKGRKGFDYLFLDHVDYFFKLGENAINLLHDSKYEKVVEQSKQEGILCHHDFTHHNIICNGNNTSIINFEFCCFELKVYDIANFLRRKMRKCNWDIKEAKLIIENYNKIEKISNDEFIIMKIILQFPQKFWRVVNKYYNSKRSWSEKSYINKLQEVLEEIEGHKKFIDRFDSLL